MSKMSKTVYCRKYHENLEALERAPLPGKLGEEILQTVSKRAWKDWQRLQTMLINEKHLSLLDPDARSYLMTQMQKFFDNEATDHAEGYVAPEPPGEA